MDSLEQIQGLVFFLYKPFGDKKLYFIFFMLDITFATSSTTASLFYLRDIIDDTSTESDSNITLAEKLDIYKKFVRSHLEQSCTVWNSSLTRGNEKDIERVQKSALRLILKEKFTNYEDALLSLNIKTLRERRKVLCAKFALKSLRHNKTRHMFKINTNKSHIKLRNKKKLIETKNKTSRLKNSSIPYMEKLINQHYKDKESEIRSEEF